MTQEAKETDSPLNEERRAAAEAQIETFRREVRFDIREFPVEVIVQKYLEGLEEGRNELFIPDYQRDMAWSEARQARFIESVMIGLPVPYLFAADLGAGEEDEGRIEIVDGSQRIRTLARFLQDRLRLEGLDKLKALNGFTFSDFPLSRQRRFKRTTLRLIELEKDTTEDVRRDIFERINTGSVELTDMEVRKGIYDGPFFKMIEECAALPLFKELAPISASLVKRRERDEFVLRFFAYLDRREKFQREVREFMTQYLRDQDQWIAEHPAESAGFLAGKKQIWVDMLNFVKAHFPHGFKKGPQFTTTPKIRFEAIAVGTALALSETPTVAPSPTEEWSKSKVFSLLTTSDSSNSQPKLRRRIDFVRRKVLGLPTDDIEAEVLKVDPLEA